MNNTKLLQQAKTKYKHGDTYLSASGLLDTPLEVIGKIHFGYFQTENIYCSTGLLYDASQDRWGEVLEK